jgi:hypothetical protein
MGAITVLTKLQAHWVAHREETSWSLHTEASVLVKPYNKDEQGSYVHAQHASSGLSCRETRNFAIRDALKLSCGLCVIILVKTKTVMAHLCTCEIVQLSTLWNDFSLPAW